MRRIELTSEQRGETEDEIRKGRTKNRVLGALNLKSFGDGGTVYAGTVSKPDIQRRRKANKVARKSRKANRH